MPVYRIYFLLNIGPTEANILRIYLDRDFIKLDIK